MNENKELKVGEFKLTQCNSQEYRVSRNDTSFGTIYKYDSRTDPYFEVESEASLHVEHLDFIRLCFKVIDSIFN